MVSTQLFSAAYTMRSDYRGSVSKSKVSAVRTRQHLLFTPTPEKRTRRGAQQLHGKFRVGEGTLDTVHGCCHMAIDPRIPITYNTGTEHGGFSSTRQTLPTPSAKRREELGESREG